MNRKAFFRSCFETFKMLTRFPNSAIHELTRNNSNEGSVSCCFVWLSGSDCCRSFSETFYRAIATQFFSNKISSTESAPKTNNKLTAT